MAVASSQPASLTVSHEAVHAPVLSVDTTSGSVLHRVFAYSGRPEFILKLYATSLALTFLPLLGGALLSPLSLTVPSHTLRLPLLRDWSVLFMLFVSFPCLVILTISDQHVLSSSLNSVQLDETVTISQEEASSLADRWYKRFRTVNFAGQAAGIVVGAVIAYFNGVVYRPASVGFWIARGGRILPVGFVYQYCIFLFYALVAIYVLRNFAISLLLKDIVDHSRLRLQPLHPDHCGGLRPVGRLGLRNQYVLMLLGLNLVLLVMISASYLRIPPSLHDLLASAVVAYLILGPLVFMAPLLPFRGGMLRTKAELVGQVAQRLRVELQRLRAQLKSGPITKEDEELIRRLRKIADVFDELPVWPFDAVTLRKFLAAYVIPMLTSVGFPVAKFAMAFFQAHVHVQ